jgi:hypothetical protein
MSAARGDDNHSRAQERVGFMTPTWNAKAAKAANEYILSSRPLRPLRSIVDVRPPVF